MKKLIHLANEAGECWTTANPMNKRDARGHTSWGVYSLGYEEGFRAALKIAAEEAKGYTSGQEAADEILVILNDNL